jgi:hypothetical protein
MRESDEAGALPGRVSARGREQKYGSVPRLRWSSGMNGTVREEGNRCAAPSPLVIALMRHHASLARDGDPPYLHGMTSVEVPWDGEARNGDE